MASLSPIPILFLAASFLPALLLASDTKGHGKGAAKMPEYNYIDAAAWGESHPEFELCSTGKRQSPIDINTYEIVLNETLQPLAREYRVTNASLSCSGKSIELLFGGGEGELRVEGKEYKLTQFHFHTPSEHQLNGIQYAAELHQVHIAADGSRAAVGVLFKLGEPSPFVKMLMPQLAELAKKPSCSQQKSLVIPNFNCNLLRKWPRNYYRYQGSLTSPSCVEDVTWSILTEAKTISKKQVEALKAPLCQENKNNARPIQPLNGRKVQKYDRS